MNQPKLTMQRLQKPDVLEYAPTKIFSLKNHPHYNESWLHQIILSDLTVLNLGDLEFRDHERRQPRSGRLDLLLEDVEIKKRYEVEIQLGATDESHLIRTIEYWDNERKRYPQYDHCAVIIAEDITSRFLNVISLFNGHIPIIAIQVKAFQINGQISLLFTKVLNEIELGIPENEIQEPEKNRSYWEEKGTPNTVQLADSILNYILEFASGFQLKYNKHYIGLTLNNKAQNFISLKPQKTNIRIDLGCQIDDEFRSFLEKEGLDVYEYNPHWKVHPISLSTEQIQSKQTVVIKALKYAYEKYYSK